MMQAMRGGGRDHPPVVERGEDVDDDEVLHHVWPIERHAIGDAPAAVVPHDGESGEPEGAHRLDHAGGHAPLGVGAMTVVGSGTGAGAVAGEVRGYDAEAPGKLAGDPVPGEMRLGVAVQQEQRRAGAGSRQGDAAAGGRHVPRRESRQQVGIRWARHRSPSRATARLPISRRQKPPGQSIASTAA